ncbi:DUF3987 domain-containing protein [Vineibacter terrae]|nr:DUF3987 domain-containing protein [Vineibacter terrae]
MRDKTKGTALSDVRPDAGWPEPDRTLLDGSPGDRPVFPAELLPPFWRDWCQDMAHGTGVAVDHVALALLTAAAGLLGGARRVSPAPAWTEPCVLWAALVGAPSSGKTAAMEAALRLVRALSDDLGAQNEALRRRHVTAQETARAEDGWWRDEVRGAVANHLTPPPMPAAADAPQPFAPRRLLVEGSAVAIVADALRGSPRGILMARDALAGWLGGMARDADAQTSFWRGAWSGSPRAAVSVLGTIEPDALGRSLADHGFGARLLFAWPGRRPFQPLLDGAASLSPEALRALARLRDLPDEARVVALAPEARHLFEDFRQALDAEADGLEDEPAAWWRKGASTVLRLAGVWTFLDWAVLPDGVAEPRDVPVDAMEACAALWRLHLWPHASAVMGSAGGSASRRQARKALLWIRRQGLSAVSRDDLWRHARAARDAPGVDHIITTLTGAGFLRPVDPGPGDGRPRRRWAVNPALPHLGCRDA